MKKKTSCSKTMNAEQTEGETTITVLFELYGWRMVNIQDEHQKMKSRNESIYIMKADAEKKNERSTWLEKQWLAEWKKAQNFTKTRRLHQKNIMQMKRTAILNGDVEADQRAI